MYAVFEVSSVPTTIVFLELNCLYFVGCSLVSRPFVIIISCFLCFLELFVCEFEQPVVQGQKEGVQVC